MHLALRFYTYINLNGILNLYLVLDIHSSIHLVNCLVKTI